MSEQKDTIDQLKGAIDKYLMDRLEEIKKETARVRLINEEKEKERNGKR